MKRSLSLLFLLLTGIAYAQVPTSPVRRDSLPLGSASDPMPNARPNNSFYRYHSDPKNVMRATLDNMPVKVPDSSTQYTILRSYQPYVKPEEPMRFLPPVPRIVPKKFRQITDCQVSVN